MAINILKIFAYRHDDIGLLVLDSKLFWHIHPTGFGWCCIVCLFYFIITLELFFKYFIMKKTNLIFAVVFSLGVLLFFGFLNKAGAERGVCATAGETRGCSICRQTLGSGGNLSNYWADDSLKCGSGQACVNGVCVNGQPSVPASFDVSIAKSGDIASVRNSAGVLLSSGTDYTKVIRDAIAAVPAGGSLFIGAGVYDGLQADQNIPINNALAANQAHYYTALPLRGKNIHIYGAGMGETILKLGNGQYYSGHQALVIFASNGLNLGYNQLTLANMTIDGNKDNQSPFWYDGAGLILTGGERSGGKFFNLELRNSPNTGLYLGNNGSGWESYSYLDNIYTHDNLQAGMVFDNVEKIKASRVKSANDGTIASGTVGLQIINVGDHKLDFTIDGAEIVNGILKIGNSEYPGAGGITINDLKIDTKISNLGLLGAVYIQNNHNTQYSLPDRGSIVIGIDSIITDSVAKNHAVWIENEPVSVVLRGGKIDSGVSFYANRASSVVVEGVLLKSSFNSLVCENSNVACANCLFDPGKGQYLYSTIGSGAQLFLNNSFATSLEKTDAVSGKVQGSLSLKTPCSDECSAAGITRCDNDVPQKCAIVEGCLKWATGSLCGAGQTCQSGNCVSSCVPKNCAALGYNCGISSDGCGGGLDCGSCASGRNCVNNSCAAVCVPKTCSEMGYVCGVQNDGCGGAVDCGACPAGKTCTNNGCAAVCVPKTCSEMGYVCGSWSDGCGSTVDCGICAGGKSCSVGKCVDSCEPHAYKKCLNQNLYWYNSCGKREGLAQMCGSDQFTSEYRCDGNQVQRQILSQGCFEDSCYSTPEWKSTCRCAGGEICSNGNCIDSNAGVANSDAGGSEFGFGVTSTQSTTRTADVDDAANGTSFSSQSSVLKAVNKSTVTSNAEVTANSTASVSSTATANTGTGGWSVEALNPLSDQNKQISSRIESIKGEISILQGLINQFRLRF